MSSSTDTPVQSIPDTQNKEDTRKIPIDKVGIKGIKPVSYTHLRAHET